VIILAAWVVCSILTYGITFAHFSREYENNDTSGACFALFFSVFGPFGLVVSFISSGCAKHGLRFRK